MDPDQETEAQQNKVANDDPSRTTYLGPDHVTLSNYWLNEIKSQEDTARQIMTICILLLGASITLITGNSKSIIYAIGNSTNLTFQVYLPIVPEKYLPLYDSLFHPFLYFSLLSSVLSFFIVWILALNIAIESLKPEPTRSKAPRYPEHLSFIANIKFKLCKKATRIIITGTSLTAIFIISLISSQNIGYIGSSVVILAALVLQIYVLYIVISELRQKQVSRRHPLTPPLGIDRK